MSYSQLMSVYIGRGAPWHANNLYPCFRIKVYCSIFRRGHFLTWVIKNQVFGQRLDQHPPADNNFKV